MAPDIIIYLLKVNLALTAFYAGYHFVLQRYTFYAINRFYLLIGLIYSALYPLIDISTLLNGNEQLKVKIGILAPDWQGSVNYLVDGGHNGIANYWLAVLLVFWIGVTFLSVRLAIQLISLLRLHLRSEPLRSGTISFRAVSTAVNPFSFWRTIYLNPKCHAANELASILEHEQVHVKQLHTLDVLLAELSTIFYWFNPGVWLMKKAIKANLEFITDQEVIRSGIDCKDYQYTILKSQALAQEALPVNNFHFLTIKKRIAMINKKPSNRVNLSGYLFILPAIMVMCLIVGASSATLNNKTVSKVISELPSRSGVTEILQSHAESKGEIMTLNELTTESINSLNSISRNDTSTKDTSRKITTIRISGAGLESRNVINIISTADGKNDTVKTIRPEPLFILDGQRVMQGIGTIKPENIASINVLKGSRAISSYGPDAVNGVIQITSKGFQSESERSRLREIEAPGYGRNEKVSLDDIDDQLIILDGHEVTKRELAELKVSSIKSIEVVKGAEATSKYGEKGIKGVIVISLK